jgi:hypothetical protein
MAAPGAGNGSSGRNSGSMEEDDLIISFVKTEYQNADTIQKEQNLAQRMFVEYTRFFEQLLANNSSLKIHRIIYGVGTTNQNSNIINMLLKKLKKENNKGEITIIVNIDSRFDDYDQIKREFNSIKRDIPMVNENKKIFNVKLGEYDANVYKLTDLQVYLLFLPFNLHSNYFTDKKGYLEKQNEIKKHSITDLINKCKPAKNNVYTSLLNFVTKQEFKEFYVLNDAFIRSFNMNTKQYYNTNTYWEDLCELFYILEKARANKKYIIQQKNFNIFKTNVYDNNFFNLTPFSRLLTFKLDKKSNAIKNYSRRVNVDEQALGAGAGSERGGKRRTITRKQKKKIQKE